MEPSPQPLDYSPERPLLTRRRKRIIAALIVVVSIAFAVWRYGSFLIDHASYLYYQRQCAHFVMPDHPLTSFPACFTNLEQLARDKLALPRTNLPLRFKRDQFLYLGKITAQDGTPCIVAIFTETDSSMPGRFQYCYLMTQIVPIVGPLENHVRASWANTYGYSLPLLDTQALQPATISTDHPSRLHISIPGFEPTKDDPMNPSQIRGVDLTLQDARTFNIKLEIVEPSTAPAIPKWLRDKPPTTQPQL